jgi:hypothetical protein
LWLLSKHFSMFASSLREVTIRVTGIKGSFESKASSG